MHHERRLKASAQVRTKPLEQKESGMPNLKSISLKSPAEVIEGLPLKKQQEIVRKVQEDEATKRTREYFKAKEGQYFTYGNKSSGTAARPTLPKHVILDAIEHAEKSIAVLMYMFTDIDIVYALVGAANREVDVKVLVDARNSVENKSMYRCLLILKQEAPTKWLKIYKVKPPEGSLHHKVCVIDDHTLIEGSYNWTVSAATRSCEHITLLVCRAWVQPWLARVAGFLKVSEEWGNIIPLQTYLGWNKVDSAIADNNDALPEDAPDAATDEDMLHPQSEDNESLDDAADDAA